MRGIDRSGQSAVGHDVGDRAAVSTDDRGPLARRGGHDGWDFLGPAQRSTVGRLSRVNGEGCCWGGDQAYRRNDQGQTFAHRGVPFHLSVLPPVGHGSRPVSGGTLASLRPVLVARQTASSLPTYHQPMTDMSNSRGLTRFGLAMGMATLTLVMLVGTGVQATTVTVAAMNFEFSPASRTIAVGDTVHWTFSGDPHSVTSRDGLFDSGITNPGGSFQFRFTTAGTFRYFCQVHPEQMFGPIVVKAASATPRPTGRPTVKPSPQPTVRPTVRPSPTATPAPTPTPTSAPSESPAPSLVAASSATSGASLPV